MTRFRGLPSGQRGIWGVVLVVLPSGEFQWRFMMKFSHMNQLH